VHKTRALLHAALFELLREKDYQRINVGEILERANVGRSTFYTHYRNKDELLASAIEEMLDSVRAPAHAVSSDLLERVVGFSLRVFEHIQRHRSAAGARMGNRGRAVLHEHVRRVLARWIAEELSREATGGPVMPAHIPQALLAEYAASTFVLVLDWWIDGKCTQSPARADALFRSLILPTLGASGASSARSSSASRPLPAR